MPKNGDDRHARHRRAGRGASGAAGGRGEPSSPSCRFVDDVTAQLARSTGFYGAAPDPWSRPLGQRATAPFVPVATGAGAVGRHRPKENTAKRKKKIEKMRKDKKESKGSDGIGAAAAGSDAQAALSRSTISKGLRAWTRRFEAETYEADKAANGAALGSAGVSEWHRRYRAWVTEWGVAAGDCRRAARRGRSAEVAITLRAVRAACRARSDGCAALHALLAAATEHQRRDRLWQRLHDFGADFAGLTRQLVSWLNEVDPRGGGSTAAVP